MGDAKLVESSSYRKRLSGLNLELSRIPRNRVQLADESAVYFGSN